MSLARSSFGKRACLVPYPRTPTSRSALASRTAWPRSAVGCSNPAANAPSSRSADSTLQSPYTPACYFSSSPRRLVADSGLPHAEKHPVAALRNISIIAHIDAGKTTLTERLLHLTDALAGNGGSGSTAALPGDVDSGSTVTDFLEQERQRGITIQSAAVGPVWWPKPSASKSTGARETVGITLVDTPGHIDFGIEVERALRVVDGAVVVLDGVEGVESQTENVWSQAARYDVKASILFINKLDRMGSSVTQSLRSVIRSGMHQRPLLLQLPIPLKSKDEPGVSGLVDLLEMQTVTFSGKAGETVNRKPLQEADEMYAEAKQARHALVECLASLDDQLLEELFSLPTSSNEEPHGKMPAASLRQAIRRQTLAGTVLPVLCGSAAKNVGVQPLLDAIADYLPSPADKPSVVGNVAHRAGKNDAKANAGAEVSLSLKDKRTTALAFKVVHDKRRGPTTFVRVYSGTLQRSSVLFNTTTGARERLSRVLFPFADQYVETASLRAGQIGVILGLRDTRTGDTLVDVSSTPAGSKSDKGLDAADAKTLRLKRVHIPPPVFSMSLEPASKSDVDAVSDALNLLIRTDPSLRLDEGSSAGAGTTGQTVVSGMGELHLEIAKDRLENEFGVNARMGAVRVSYRETVDEGAGELEASEVLERDLAGKRIKIGARIRVSALAEDEQHRISQSDAAVFGGNVVDVVLGTPPSNGQSASGGKGSSKSTGKEDSTTIGLPAGVDMASVEAMFKSGMVAALSRGPLTSNPLMGLRVTVDNIEMFGDLSSSAAISYVLSHLVRKVLRTEPKLDPQTGMVVQPGQARTVLMEPMMATRITVPAVHLGKVINDITAEQDGLVNDVVHQTNSQDGSETEEQAEEAVYIPPRESRFEMQSASAASGKGDAEKQAGKAEIHAVVPLANLVRYSSKLRALTAGNAQFNMQLQGFARVSQHRQAEILADLGR
ncbi:p-loop containing nucleoside triphosphate hydrolase protein [Moesziomyces antarcticus]|uniref:Related to MEF2 - translation elongation factor, mitochondrial n=1 Tax=Pseudozyma antarctica TaxID=84753 RepID=A0A5C3FIJ1_PSEA2|nr:p-loop containing nucleoside triphosphate hydrolase protein [Moesziomyces antarcticus]GAK63534.1 p-loop containing nucleoside triphosphate hydrolase protein [Moesziomyces antarcticus]SPO44124.1 related to MEF2 - translation elongation factor, mitochondrial [Moesziomyces antarcticus]